MGKLLLALASTVILSSESHGTYADAHSDSVQLPCFLIENSQIYEIYYTLLPVCTVATAVKAIKRLIPSPSA
jgi:hypothetical protein